MLRTGIYVDAENIKMSGGFGMRYDVLVGLANSPDSVMLRANCYLAEDTERTVRDSEYRQKVHSYHNILRQCGFKVIKKTVRRFQDEDGNITTKANADMDLAIDALLQARNLDRIILLTGDGDFLRLVVALQNIGCRVEVIGFPMSAKSCARAPTPTSPASWCPACCPSSALQGRHRGPVAARHGGQYSRPGVRLLSLLPPDRQRVSSDTVFFHLSKSTLPSDHFFQEPHRIFEFRVVENPTNSNRSEAWEIRLLKEG